MTFVEAYKTAADKARQLGEPRYVVVDQGEFHAATKFDLQTWYRGKTPVCECEPNGEVH